MGRVYLKCKHVSHLLSRGGCWGGKAARRSDCSHHAQHQTRQHHVSAMETEVGPGQKGLRMDLKHEDS